MNPLQWSRTKKMILAVAAVLIGLVVIAVAVGLPQRKENGEAPQTTEQQKETDGQQEAEKKQEADGQQENEEQQNASDAQENAVQPVTDPLEGFTRQEQTVWTTARLNLRQAPGTDTQVLKVLSYGAKLESSAFNENWYYVTVKDVSGFVSAKYITKEEPKQVQQPTTAPSTYTPGNVTRPAGSTGHVVVIDPGHQAKGDNSLEPNGPGSSVMKARVAGGTRGRTTGVYEYELTLTIGQQLKAELEKRGYTVYMTRTSHNVNISNKQRAEYANEVGGEIAVRLHGNGSDNTSVSGALALAPSSSNPYISHLAASSQQLSRNILNAYCNATGMRNRGVSGSDTMTGINWSSVPVTILEMGFMTNASDDTNMQDSAFQQRMVQGIADGIDDYFGL